MKLQLGRHFYGFGAISFGVITLLWHQISSLGNISHPEILIYTLGIAEIIGGLAIMWRKTIKFGAIVLGMIYLIFSLYLIQFIVMRPLVYGSWGNFFEEFSIFLGSVFVLTSTIRNDPEKADLITRTAYLCFGICVISYSLYQLFYLNYTAGLVPKWIPPGQMFWAVATTIAFAIAAVAILSGHSALLASRLLVIMFIVFILLVWLPACIINPHGLSKWISTAKTIAVAGSVWIVTDYLYQLKTTGLKTTDDSISVAESRN
jgi:hypothetical protein